MKEPEQWPLLGSHSHLCTILYWKMKFWVKNFRPYQLPGEIRSPLRFEYVSGTCKGSPSADSPDHGLYHENGGKFKSPGKLMLWKLVSLEDNSGFGRRKTISHCGGSSGLRFDTVSESFLAVLGSSGRPEWLAWSLIPSPLCLFCALFPALDDLFHFQNKPFPPSPCLGEASWRKRAVLAAVLQIAPLCEVIVTVIKTETVWNFLWKFDVAIVFKCGSFLFYRHINLWELRKSKAQKYCLPLNLNSNTENNG